MKRAIALAVILSSVAACRVQLVPPPQPMVAVIPQLDIVTIAEGRMAVPNTMGSLCLGGKDGAFLPSARAILNVFMDHLHSQGWVNSHTLYEEPPAVADPVGFVWFSVEPGELERFGDEGYALKVTGSGLIRLSSARPAGLFYGVQTLRQLLMARPAGTPLSLPCLEIVDKPRFAWRGFMLDCCRHFFPKEFIKKCLDEMALFKLNRFHWHLTDDQAWRIEIKKYPELVGKAGVPTGGYYTQEDVREIVAYAAERFITVVPEIEMPGHATAALNAFPALSCTGGPFARMPQWGVFADVFCAGNDETFAFLRSVLDEVAALFPGPWLHVGGDECPKARWQACAKCQSRKQAEGLKSEAELQGWFIRRIERHLSSRGKRLIGWDEILEGGLAPNAAVMSWRGLQGGIEAARRGHDVVMAPTTSVYLDYYQGDPRFEPPAIGGFLPLEKVHAFEPTPAELGEHEAGHILGGQANLWTEYIATPEHASYMMWPRLAALAEAVWSSPSGRDWDSFLGRLSALRPAMRSLGMNVADTPWRPVVRASALPGKKAWSIEMVHGLPAAAIRFALDGGVPGPRSRLFRGPFELANGGVVRAALFAGREPHAPPVELLIHKHQAVFAPVQLRAGDSLRPEHGGEALLVDGLSASLNHKDGAWLGVEGGDLEAVIDLKSAKPIGRISTRFLEHPAAWIFLPEKVDADVSLDGKKWAPAASLEWRPQDDLTVLRSRDADLHFAPRRARYVRLVARGIGLCPPGHTGAGGKAWLFTDEIVVE